jgi:hypothetical protein
VAIAPALQEALAQRLAEPPRRSSAVAILVPSCFLSAVGAAVGGVAWLAPAIDGQLLGTVSAIAAAAAGLFLAGFSLGMLQSRGPR